MKRVLVLLTSMTTAALVGVAFGAERREAPQPVALQEKHKEGEDDHKDGKHPEDEHKGEKKDLGTQKIGTHDVQVTLVGDVKPGEEAIFVITLSGETAKPKNVRGWVGVESGEGSIRTKAEDEDKEYHLHHQVSKPLPANSKLWVELETAAGRQKGSFAIKQ